MAAPNDIFLMWLTYLLAGAVVLKLFYEVFFECDDIEEDMVIHSNIITRHQGPVSLPSTLANARSTLVRSAEHDRCFEDFITGNRHCRRHFRRRKLPSYHHFCPNIPRGETSFCVPQMCKSTNVMKRRLALLPKLANCEFDGQAAQEMKKLFPEEDMIDILRFLLARKGNLDQAAAMMRSALDWHSSNFPAKKHEIVSALQTGCFFYHGTALDGTPILFMRGAFYSSKHATPNQYVLAAAYVIDRVLAESDQISVSVLVHASGVDGAPNESADINFIKLFVQVLSDNYPERLKRLVIYPFPWFARALWGIIKMFVDKRTQDKVVLISGARKTTSLPLTSELLISVFHFCPHG